MSGNMNDYATGTSAASPMGKGKLALIGLAIIAALILIVVVWIKPAAEGYRVREFGQRGITSTVSGVPNPGLGGMN